MQAVLCILYVVSMDIILVVPFNLQSHGAKMKAQHAKHDTRLQRHTDQTHSRKKHRPDGHTDNITGKHSQQRRGQLVHMGNTATEQSESVRSHGNTRIRTATWRLWRGNHWKKHNLCITVMNKLGIGKALFTSTLQWHLNV